MKPQVILLYNHDNAWTPEDARFAAEDRRKAMSALTNFGYHVLDVKVYDSVTEALRPFRFDPREWLVFNWCEGYADRPWDYAEVTTELDQLGFTYTGRRYLVALLIGGQGAGAGGADRAARADPARPHSARSLRDRLVHLSGDREADQSTWQFRHRSGCHRAGRAAAAPARRVY